jgi:hypothetical protein
VNISIGAENNLSWLTEPKNLVAKVKADKFDMPRDALVRTKKFLPKRSMLIVEHTIRQINQKTVILCRP